jgi:hypothetical protein
MKPLQMMPTFAHAGERDTTFLSDIAQKLNGFGVRLPSAATDGKFHVYSGDLSVSDKGEILVWQSS